MDPNHASLLETANALMTLAFALEMVLKLIGLGVAGTGSFNWFDAGIVAGLVELAGAGGASRAPRAASSARASQSEDSSAIQADARADGERRQGRRRDARFPTRPLPLPVHLHRPRHAALRRLGRVRRRAQEFRHHLEFLPHRVRGAHRERLAVGDVARDGRDGRVGVCVFVAWIFVGHFIFLDLLLAILVFNFSRETADERLEREEREQLEAAMTGGEKRGLDKTAGGEVVMDRMIRRKNRKFSDQADAMRRWLRETDQMYATTKSRTRTRTRRLRRRNAFDARRASWKSWRTSTTTTTRRSETTTITTTPTTAPRRRRSTSIASIPARASRPP